VTCHTGGTRLIDASPSVQALLGYDAGEFLAGRVALPQLIHADDRDIADVLFSPLRSNHEGDCNLRVRQAGGRILCVKGHYRREPHGDGVTLDLLLQDVKTLPRTIADITASECAWAVMENTDDYIYFKDRNHVFTGASQTLVSLTSTATHWTDLIGKTDYDVFPEASADSFYRLEKQVFAGVPIAHEIQETVVEDGRTGWVDNRKYPIRDAGGAIIGLHGIARDITAARNADAALHVSLARSQAIIDASPVPMATNDKGQRITLVNPAFVRTFGYDHSEIPTLADWWPKAYPDPAYRQWVMESWQEELARSARTGTAFEPMEITVRCKDGTERVVRASAAPLGHHETGDYLVVLQDITADKRAEQQLERSAFALAEAQRLARIGSWELFSASDVMTWSEELFRIFGMDPNAPTPTYPEHERLVTPESWQRLTAAVQLNLATGQRYEMELEIVRADGSHGWIWVRGERVQDDRGVTIGLRGVALDISDRKMADLMLRASEERWRFAVEGAGDGAWDWDIPSGAVNYSRRWIEMLGYEPHEIAPTIDEWRRLAHPDDAEQVLGEVQVHWDGHTGSSSNEYRMRCKDGSWKWILGRGLVVERDAAGLPLRMIGTNSDISARKQAELDLLKSEQALAEAQRIAHLGSWELDVATNQIVLSDELCRIYGFDPALPAPPLAEHEALYTPKGWETLRAAIAGSTSTGRPYEIELERRMPDGSEGWLMARGEVVTDDQGAIIGLRGVAQDITARKRMEMENAEIEAKLQRSQRLETVGTLAAGIAHDFNNLLAAIVGNAELAVVDMDPAHPAREHLLEIEKASTRAKTVVQQLLAFSRQHPQVRHPIALGPVIIEATTLLRATMPAAVQIVTSVEAEAPPVLADAGQIHQILINLCTNAWHALDDRPGTINVHLKSVSLDARAANAVGGLVPGPYACLSVRDTGKGMDAATLERIFNPFFTTKEPGKGTGLGLSVVHGIVAAHQGAIHVASRPGEGSTFTLYFPASELAVAVTPPTAPVAKSSPDVKGHILYLDDEDMLARVATRALQRLGFTVTTFARPTEAVKAFANDPLRFDAVITDMNMPEADGISVARQLRGIRPDVPMVLVSGSIDEALRQAAAEAGIAGVLCKPFTMQELKEVVLPVLDGRQP